MSIDLVTFASPIAFNSYQQSVKGRRHAILPARKFEHSGRSFDVTESDLSQMAQNLKIRRPVTIAHPDLSSAEAIGWIIPGTAEVSSFGAKGKALYVQIEWTPQAEQAIDEKRYGYISPVFSLGAKDEAGNSIGACLRAAGLTNDPHWSEDQPLLWEQFTKSIDNNNELAATATKQNKQTQEARDMPKIEELEATLKAVTAERDELKLKHDKVEADFIAFTATRSAKEAELESKVQRIQGERLLEKHSDKVREKHLKNADGTDTPLGVAVFSNSELAEYMISLIPDPQNTNTTPVGFASGSNNTSNEDIALTYAREEAKKDQSKNVVVLYSEKLNELNGGK